MQTYYMCADSLQKHQQITLYNNIQQGNDTMK